MRATICARTVRLQHRKALIPIYPLPPPTRPTKHPLRKDLTTIAVMTSARPAITASSARGLSLEPRSLRCASKGVVPSGEGQGGGGKEVRWESACIHSNVW